MASESKSNWLGPQSGSSSWLGPMTLELTITQEPPGVGTMKGSGLMVIFFSQPGTWATPVLDATYSGMSVSGTISGVPQDPVAISGTIHDGYSITLGGDFGPFGNATWNLTGIRQIDQQITGVWAGTFGSGQSLEVTLLQTGNNVVGIGTLAVMIQGNLMTINVVVNGTASYPSFDLTVSMINPSFFSVGLTGKASDANTLNGTLALETPTPVTLTRQTAAASADKAGGAFRNVEDS